MRRVYRFSQKLFNFDFIKDNWKMLSGITGIVVIAAGLGIFAAMNSSKKGESNSSKTSNTSTNQQSTNSDNQPEKDPLGSTTTDTPVKTTKTVGVLNISPSSLTVYKNSSGGVVAGLKPNITTQSFSASSSDGDNLDKITAKNEDGSATAVVISSSLAQARSSWLMSVAVDQVTVGTQTLKLTATDSSDTTKSYVGILTVEVVNLPTFKIALDGSAEATLGTSPTAVLTQNFIYSDDNSGSFQPKVSISPANISGCTAGAPTLTKFICTVLDNASPITTPILITYTFDNKFQSVSLATSLPVTNNL